jgi:hypothetical protein
MNCNGNEAAFEDKTAIPERRLWLAIIVQALEEWALSCAAFSANIRFCLLNLQEFCRNLRFWKLSSAVFIGRRVLDARGIRKSKASRTWARTSSRQ